MKKINGKNILSIGCDYIPPKGGVAQVMYTYSQEIYSTFHCITNSGAKNAVGKLLQALWGIVHMIIYLIYYNNIRIVHIHTASYKSFIRSSWYLRVAKMIGKKTILHIHGGAFKDYYKTNPKWILKILLKADCIFALTESWNRFFSDELHLPNVVTVQNIIPTPVIKEVDRDERIHLLFLGAINDQKGIFDLLSVINQHRMEWHGKLVLHVGGDQEVERLQYYITEHDLGDLVKYEGWVNGEKKIELLNLMDVFILPSYVEGLPISILESLSYGKPVITTPVGGIPEVVNDTNGFIFAPGDVTALSEILKGIIINPTILKKKSNHAMDSVKSNFPYSITKVLDKTYMNLLKEK